MRLSPTDKRYFQLLTDAADNLVTAADLLTRLVDAAPEQRREIAARMREVEHAGDDVTHEVMKRLNSSFVTPFDREDISALAGRIDDVLDCMDAAADLTVLYGIDRFPDGVGGQAKLLTQAAKVTAAAMPRLASPADLEPYWIEINDLENQADDTYRSLLAHLFTNGTDALTVLALKDVIDQLEAAADGFEHVADVVQTIAVKES
jgi:uncharacterized protein